MGVCADTQRAHTDPASFVKGFWTFYFKKWKKLNVITLVENYVKYCQSFLYLLKYIKGYFKIKNRFPEGGESGVFEDLVCSYKQDSLTPKKTVN
jgi:hypothetical protein